MTEVEYRITASKLLAAGQRLKRIIKPVVPFRRDRLEMANEVIEQDQRLALEIVNLLPLPSGWDEEVAAEGPEKGKKQ